jgi:hypothetical protein
MTLACSEIVAGFPSAAAATLSRMLDEAPPGSAGWTLPVEPWIAPIRGDQGIRAVLSRLSLRAD